MTTNQDRKWPAGTADKMNEWAERQLGLSLEPWQMDLLRQMEVSKPRTLAEMTRDEWKACQWMQAEFDGEVVLLTKVGPDQVAFLHKSGTPGVRTSSWFHRITPLPDLRRMGWPEEQATNHDDEGMTPEVEEGLYGQALWDMFTKAIRDEKEYHIDAQDYEGVKRWRDAERALRTALETNSPKESSTQPQPEYVKPDPQPGEAWLIEYEGKRYEAIYWYSPLYAHWSFVANREVLNSVESPEATPVSRLVPEVTE